MKQIKAKDLIKYLKKKPQDNYIFIPNWEYGEFQALSDDEMLSWKIRKINRIPKW